MAPPVDLCTATREQLLAASLHKIGQARIDKFLRYRDSIPSLNSSSMVSCPDYSYWYSHLVEGRLYFSTVGEGVAELVPPGTPLGLKSKPEAGSSPHTSAAEEPSPDIAHMSVVTSSQMTEYFESLLAQQSSFFGEISKKLTESIDAQQLMFRQWSDDEERRSSKLLSSIQNIVARSQPTHTVAFQQQGQGDGNLLGAMGGSDSDVKYSLPSYNPRFPPPQHHNMTPPPQHQEARSQFPQQSRSRMEPAQKMPKFGGRAGDPADWSAFFLKFERLAVRNAWTEDVRLDRLIDCLSDDALYYFSRLPRVTQEDYQALCISMAGRFTITDPAPSARRKLKEVQQGAEEPLQEFAGRVQQLTVTAYPNVDQQTIQLLATEHFLSGCRDGLAKLLTMGQNPPSLERALQLMRAQTANQEVVYGTGGAAKVRQLVRFKEEAPPEILEGRLGQVERDVALIRDGVSSLRLMMERGWDDKPLHTSRRDTSPYRQSSASGRSSLPRGSCFTCGEAGHFSRECPKEALNHQRD